MNAIVREFEVRWRPSRHGVTTCTGILNRRGHLAQCVTHTQYWRTASGGCSFPTAPYRAEQTSDAEIDDQSGHVGQCGDQSEARVALVTGSGKGIGRAWHGETTH